MANGSSRGFGSYYPTTGTGYGIRRPQMRSRDPWADAAGDIAKALNSLLSDSATQEQRDRVFNRQIIASLAKIDPNMEPELIEKRMNTMIKLGQTETDPILKEFTTALTDEMQGVLQMSRVRDEFSDSFAATQTALDNLQERYHKEGDYTGAGGARGILNKMEGAYRENIENFSNAERQMYNRELKNMNTTASVMSALEMMDIDKDKRGIQIDETEYTPASQQLIKQAEDFMAVDQAPYAMRSLYAVGAQEAKAEKMESATVVNDARVAVNQLDALFYAFRDDIPDDIMEGMGNIRAMAQNPIPANTSPEVIAAQRETLASGMLKIIRDQYGGAGRLRGGYPEQITTRDASGKEMVHNFGDDMRAYDEKEATASETLEKVMAAFNMQYIDKQGILPGGEGAVPRGMRETQEEKDKSGSHWSRRATDQWQYDTIEKMYTAYERLKEFEIYRTGTYSSQTGPSQLNQTLGAGSGWTVPPTR